MILTLPLYFCKFVQIKILGCIGWGRFAFGFAPAFGSEVGPSARSLFGGLKPTASTLFCLPAAPRPFPVILTLPLYFVNSSKYKWLRCIVVFVVASPSVTLQPTAVRYWPSA